MASILIHPFLPKTHGFAFLFLSQRRCRRGPPPSEVLFLVSGRDSAHPISVPWEDFSARFPDGTAEILGMSRLPGGHDVMHSTLRQPQRRGDRSGAVAGLVKCPDLLPVHDDLRPAQRLSLFNGLEG